MNYYGPRQRQTDRRWDYTRRNNDQVWPQGYCQGTFDGVWPAQPRESHIMAWGTRERYLADREAHLPYRAAYHDSGHPTAEEACACYRAYLLNHHLKLDGEYANVKHRCQAEGCQEWTSRYASVDLRHFDLCDSHRTRAEVERLFPSVGEQIGSC